MAQNEIEHACGHTQIHQLFGPMRDREKKRDWLVNTLCTDCWRAERDLEPPQVYARKTQGGMEIIATKSYAQRETLKGRGYKYGQYVIEGGITPLFSLVDRGGTNGWAQVFTGESSLVDEVEWIVSQGWPLHIITPMPKVVANLVAEWEGRPDLAPAEATK